MIFKFEKNIGYVSKTKPCRTPNEKTRSENLHFYVTC